MAVTIGSVGTSTLSGSNITVSKPSGTVAGDVLIASVGGIFSATSPSGPSGWTERLFGTFGDAVYTVWAKTAGSSEPTSYTWTTGATSGDVGAGSILRFTGSIDQVNSYVRAEVADSGTASGFTPEDLNGHGGTVNTPDASMYTAFFTNGDGISNTGSSSWSGTGWTQAQKYDSYWNPGGQDYSQITVYRSGHGSPPAFTQSNSFGSGNVVTYGLAIATVSGYPNLINVSVSAQNAGRLFLAGQKFRASYMGNTAGKYLRGVDNPGGALPAGAILKASQA